MLSKTKDIIVWGIVYIIISFFVIFVIYKNIHVVEVPEENLINPASSNTVLQQPLKDNPPFIVSVDDLRYVALQQSLPYFEDYPVKVYPIPPKPKIDHQSFQGGDYDWT